MLLSILLTAMLQSPSSAAAPPSLEAIYLVQQGPAGLRGEINRLLDTWSADRTIRSRTPRTTAIRFDNCLPREARTRPDLGCVRRLLPAGAALPAVAIIARDSGRRNLVWDITCVSSRGAGRGTVSSGDLFSAHVRTRNDARSAVAACISGALNGAVQFRPDPLPRTRRVTTPFPEQFGIQDVAEARRSASDVVVISAEHVGHPRGNWSHCNVQGYVARAELGDALRPRQEGGGVQIEVDIPCGSPPRTSPRREIGRHDLHPGQLIRLFFGSDLELLHAERIDHEGLPVFVPSKVSTK